MAKIAETGELGAKAGPEEGKSMPEVHKVEVDIYGTKHSVRGEGSPEYIRGLAHEVDKKMRLLAERFPRLSVEQLAVLTALNLADELAKLREEQEALLELIGESDEERKK